MKEAWKDNCSYHPYRDGEMPKEVASRPRSRTLIARLRSWNRRRKIRSQGTFKERWHRCPECKYLNPEEKYTLEMFPGMDCCEHATYTLLGPGDLTTWYCRFKEFKK